MPAVPSVLCHAVVAACILAPTAAAASPPPRIVGIAFVDASTTSQGSRAKLPPGAVIYPPGARITGATGCPSNTFGTDGLIVAVIDHGGPPIAGSLAVIRRPAGGGEFHNAPYYLDINSGRTLQFLGPIRENGTYELRLSSRFGQLTQDNTSISFTLARGCPALE